MKAGVGGGGGCGNKRRSEKLLELWDSFLWGHEASGVFLKIMRKYDRYYR